MRERNAQFGKLTNQNVLVHLTRLLSCYTDEPSARSSHSQSRLKWTDD